MKWLLKQQPVPEEFDTAVFRQLQQFAVDPHKPWKTTQT